MENDTDRRAGPEYRQNHLRDKPVHDDLDLHAARYRRPQGEIVSSNRVNRRVFDYCNVVFPDTVVYLTKLITSYKSN